MARVARIRRSDGRLASSTIATGVAYLRALLTYVVPRRRERNIPRVATVARQVRTGLARHADAPARPVL